MDQKIEQYKFFFNDQLKEMELESKTIFASAIGSLLQKGLITMGYVDSVVPDKGHVVFKFPKGYAPRLKVPKSFFIIKKAAYSEYGTQLKNWTCSFAELKTDQTKHTVTSDLLPLHYRKVGDGYDYIVCSGVSTSTYSIIQQSIELGKSLTAIIFDPFPPVDYYINLNRYMDLFPDNAELLLQPKIEYDDWHPEELSFNPSAPNAIAERISETLDKDDICIVQGPPGTGKSYVIASIVSDYLNKGKTVCATTMANKGLIELILQDPLKPALENEKISKTNLSADEHKQAPKLKEAPQSLLTPNGELICATNYKLSGVFSAKHIEELGLPSYDLVVIEEASQAFLSAIVAFKSLGKKCLIVGDPMQIPPIVKSQNKPEYKLFNASAQIEGMKSFALGTNTKAYRIMTSFRLTPPSAKLTGVFYENRLTSVSQLKVKFPAITSPYVLNNGGVVYCVTNDVRNGVCSNSALAIIESVLSSFKKNYPDTELAIIAPFQDTVKELQKHFLMEDSLKNLTIETVDRIQGMTVDYTIMYIPAWKSGFALDEKRFNVATSRSRTTTLLLSDIFIEQMHTASGRIVRFVNGSEKILPDGSVLHPSQDNIIEADSTSPKNDSDSQAESDIPGLKVVGKIDLSKFERPKKELSKEKKNYYVIDTNVFVNCPDIISKIDSKIPVILSAKVIDELDKLKIKLDEIGKSNVQKALRSINANMDTRDVTMALANMELLPPEFDRRSPDNMILAVALKYINENPILLTSDNGLQVKAKGLGLSTVSLKDFLRR